MQTKGFAELQLAGYRQRYERIPETVDLDRVYREMEALFLQHEEREVERIQTLLSYAQETECLTAQILDYFGEKIEPCGHCGVCLDESPLRLPERQTPSINSFDLSAFESLAKTHLDALGQPRQQARFLCGLTSPAVSSKRGLRSDPFFGRCERVPFAEVLESRTR